MGRDQFVGVLVGDDRGDAGDGYHGERGRDPDESVGHRNSSLRQAFTNGSSSPKPAASRSARVRAVMAWLRWNSRRGWVETIHAPLPSAAASLLNRAVATTAPLTSRVMKSTSIRTAMMRPPLPGRSGDPVPNQVPTIPDWARPGATSPDNATALTCGNRTQCDAIRRNHDAWHNAA